MKKLLKNDPRGKIMFIDSNDHFIIAFGVGRSIAGLQCVKTKFICPFWTFKNEIFVLFIYQTSKYSAFCMITCQKCSTSNHVISPVLFLVHRSVFFSWVFLLYPVNNFKEVSNNEDMIKSWCDLLLVPIT